MALIVNENDRIKTALALYQETNNEITRYRDYEWKLPTWTAGLLIFIITGANQIDSLDIDCGKAYILKTVLAVVAVVATVFSCWYIYFLHERLTANRKIRRLLSNLFGYSEVDSFVQGKSLLPEKYKTEQPSFLNGITHVVASWIFVILSLIYTLLIIFIR